MFAARGLKIPHQHQRAMCVRVIAVLFAVAWGATIVSGSHLRHRGRSRNPNEHTSIKWSPIATHVDFNAWVPGLAFNHDAVRSFVQAFLSSCSPFELFFFVFVFGFAFSV